VIHPDIKENIVKREAELERAGYTMYESIAGKEEALKAVDQLKKWGFSVKLVPSPASEGVYRIYTKKL